MNLSAHIEKISSPMPNNFLASTEVLALMLDQLPFMVLLLGSDRQIKIANNKAAYFFDLANNQQTPSFLEPLWEPRALKAPLTLTTPHGRTLLFTIRPLKWSPTIEYLLATAQDITEQAESLAEKKLSQTIKTLGDMALGFAHIIRSPLNGIELYASVLSRELNAPNQKSLLDLAENIKDGVGSVNYCLSNFLSLARPLKPQFVSVEVAALLDKILSSLEEKIRNQNIALLLRHSRVSVLADFELLEQVLLNLFLNALEAMPLRGSLTVEVNSQPSGLAEISIKDTGPGLPTSGLHELCSPFYTTKNQPLGLGLPVSLRIMEVHQGRLLILPNEPLGVQALVSLPLAAPPADLIQFN